MVNRISDSVVNIPQNTSVKTADVEPVLPVSTESENNSLSKENAEQEYLPAEKAKKMADSMNNFLETTNTELRFKYHDELETYYVTLINSKTDEVVREIPSKKLLDMYAAMCDFVGLFVDKKI
ncbi:flagellar protein FlaG [Psychrobacillus sp. INOP01]|uniref:flagellar protein FlaG n=1 Tax=Psychrobacillus sp. INOP01 TaxID=2829187 RepID=UPI001BA8C3A6|nr:flagellar protein FlaG [Psychrobacillus sp. INOP01]QUG40795.1 flagellar protein FlaG [Psychrobacillus sp. INOP01]